MPLPRAVRLNASENPPASNLSTHHLLKLLEIQAKTIKLVSGPENMMLLNEHHPKNQVTANLL